MYVPKQDLPWSLVPLWVRAVWLFFVLDAISFYVFSIILGGDAARGFYRDGKYFLTGDGHTTEVSRTVYYYSNIHLISLGVALFFSGIGARAVASRKRKAGLH